MTVQLTSNEQVCVGAQNYLSGRLGVNKTKLINDSRNPEAVTVKYTDTRQVSRIFRLVYDSATVYLPRKREAVEPHIHPSP